MTGGPPAFEHLLRLSDDTGVFEHAVGSIPARSHGYCVDDVARALVVVTREPDPAPLVAQLGERCLAFLLSAQSTDGRFRNRLGFDRRWEDEPAVGDWWGRALWALGVAGTSHRDQRVRTVARGAFDRGASRRSPFVHSTAFAALGAAEVVEADPGDSGARALLAQAIAMIGRPQAQAEWPWPEPRLTYANAVLPEALIAAGRAIGDRRAVDDGLALLRWLLELETSDGHLSLTPVGGWGPGEERAVFDQQPIEAAAMADACARALGCTGDAHWQRGLDLAVGWFAGDNDAHTPLLDPCSGGGFDGLTANGCNANQGAESTLALIATLQHAQRRTGAAA